ncbi:MAG: hypothetical protein K0U54_01665 [Bacteroidetes bacterium]|nr:hypothetical protein [Bacteroidota bacterium]
MSTNASDEIDLGALIGSVKELFKGVLVSIFNGINFVFRNWIILLVLIVLGAVLGYFLQDDDNLPQTAKVVIRTNYDSAEYAYNALDLLLEKSKEKDLDFLAKNGFRSDSIEIKNIETQAIVSFNDITSKYEPNDRNLDALLKNIDFEEEIDKINSFKTAYKFHTVEFSLSSYASNETIDKVMDYLNNQKLIQELSTVGKQTIMENIERNDKTFAQINTILDNYSKGQPLPSPSSQIFVVDKNFNISNMLELKMELQKENRALKEELVFSDKTVIKLSDQSVYADDGGLLGNKMIIYPFLLVFFFLFFAWIRNMYKYLKGIAQS